MENEVFFARYYLSLLVRHPLRVLIPALVVFAIGLVLTLQQPRSYVSVARVGAQSPQVSDSLVKSTVTSERLQFFEQRLFSRENLVALSDRLGLVPQTNQNLTSGQVADIVRRQITVQVTPTNPNDPSSNSAILTISFEAGTPELAAAGANEVIQMLIVENRDARMSEAGQLRIFLEQEVATRQQEADSLEAEMNAFVQDNEALLPSRLQLYTSEVQELQGELQTIQVASTTLGADTRILETQLALAENPATSAENQLAEMRRELSSKQTLFTESHPEVVSLKARIEALEASLAQTPPATLPQAEPSPLVTADTAEVAMLRERVVSARHQQDYYLARRSEINERLVWLRGTIAEMPSVESNLAALQHRYTAAEADLSDMQGRLETARVGERLVNAQQDSQITIIDAPEVPIYATGNGRTRAMMVAGAVGLAIGLAFLVLLDLLDRSIKSKRDLRPILEGGTLALIPEWTPKNPGGGRNRFASLAVLLTLTTLATASQVGVQSEPGAPGWKTHIEV